MRDGWIEGRRDGQKIILLLQSQSRDISRGIYLGL